MPFVVLVQKLSSLVAMELALILMQDVTISMTVMTGLMRQTAPDSLRMKLIKSS